MPSTLREFRRLAMRAGAHDVPRVMASASLAIHKGMAPAAVLDSLIRNAGHLFDAPATLTERREQDAC
jgi:hypothetical protein